MLARTKSIPQLAKETGVPRRTLFRRLLALHALHGGDWMWRAGKAIRINVDGLRAAHPALFTPKDLIGRVEGLEEHLGDVDRQIETMAKAIGRVAGRVAGLERKAGAA